MLAAFNLLSWQTGPTRISEVSRIGSSDPNRGLLRIGIALHAQVDSSILQVGFPIEFRQNPLSAPALVQCADRTGHAGDVLDRVPLVGGIQKVLLTAEVGPVVVARVQRPVSIIGPKNQQLGLIDPIAIAVRVDDLDQRFALFGLHVLLQAQFGVVTDLIGIRTPGGLLMFHLDRHVEHVDDHGGQCMDTGVDRGG